MKRTLGLLAVTFVLWMVVPIVAAQVTNHAPQTSDPYAISVLEKCVAAAGGSQNIQNVLDYRASGNIEYNWGLSPVKGSASIRARGTSQYRFDAVLPHDTRSWLIDNGHGSVRIGDQKATSIGRHNAVTLGSFTLPVLSLAKITRSSKDFSITSQGTVGGLVRVRVYPIKDPQTDPKGTIADLQVTDYFIDPQTFMIAAVQNNAHPNQTMSKNIERILWFSDYQVVGGVSVPFSVSEMMDGAQTWKLRLTSITFNSGISDSDFEF